ncbi:MAG: L-iditol 2-dehydrogenase [Halanaerobiales bacterium]|nr:L-iditol 2-dehydrogenase [Halanaerobiales bacterium]
MKAAVYRGPGKLKIEEVKAPIIEKDDEILVKVKVSAICGTDIKTYLHGHHAFKPPVILGHEFAGEVVEVGKDVEICDVGDNVTVAPFINCGRCLFCRKGVPELCEKRYFPSNGSFAEFVKISQSYAELGIAAIPEDIDLQEAALTEPLACVINAIDDCKIQLSDKVMIIGAGPMGLLNLMVAQLRGASQIIVSELVAERRKVASDLGATVIDPTKDDLSSFISELTDGAGVDELIIAVANTETAESVLNFVRPGGKIMFFGGFPSSSSLTLDPNLMHYRQVSLLGSSGFTPQQFKQAAELINHGKINVSKLITHSFPLQEIKDAFDLSIAHQGLKIVVSI